MPNTDLRLNTVQTPALILDEQKMMRNIANLANHINGFGASLRPHLKTMKSVDAARRILSEDLNPATVSTLKEAEVFSENGVRDIIYAVGITPDKLDRVAAIRAKGCDLAVILERVVSDEIQDSPFDVFLIP